MAHDFAPINTSKSVEDKVKSNNVYETKIPANDIGERNETKIFAANDLDDSKEKDFSLSKIFYP